MALAGKTAANVWTAVQNYLFCLSVAASKARHHDRDILWRLKSVKTIPDYEVRAAWSRFLQSLELVRSEVQVSYTLNKYVPIVNFMFVDF